MEEIKIKFSDDLDVVVTKLIKIREMGGHQTYSFNGYLLSSDTVDMDSAFLMIVGETKEEYDRGQKELLESFKKEKESDERREARTKELVLKSRERGISEITPLLVLKGMRYVLMNERQNYEEFVEGLLELGCNFTIDEVKELVKANGEEDCSIFDGLRQGNVLAGALIICNARDSIYIRNVLYGRYIYTDTKDAPVKTYMRILSNKVENQ